ncbi:MAG: GMC family oxidoreductase [Ignavibacteriae bacterium]|nr:GMC family oxidoreductase [Ignavibacteriota bacterium]MCB9215902.1 GMC family oxidoreductase [Ignavibacteria bacterium]
MNVEIVIVGSGVAAAAVADRILKSKPTTSILVLEAGGKVKMKDFSIYQNYVATGGLPYNEYYDEAPPTRGCKGENRFTGNTEMSLQGSRLMMYGGSTVHWDGYSFRFKPEDFHLYTNTGHGIDWPFSYDHIEPYYGEAEGFLGVSGDSNDPSVPRSTGYPFIPFPYSLEDTLAIEAFDSLGLEYSHLPIARHGITDTTSPTAPCQTTGTCLYCPFGARYNAANTLDDMQTLESYPNLSVRTNAVVEKVIMDSKSRAKGVLYLDKNTGEYVTVEAQTVVIASGTVESPKLLLRSVSSFWENGIGNDHDLVGRNIITHPWITFETTLDRNPLHLQPEMAFPTLVSRHYDSEEEQANGKYVLINPPSTPVINLAQAMQDGKTRKEIDEMVSGKTTIQFNAMFEIFSHHDYQVTNLNRISHLGMIESLLNFNVNPTITNQMKAVEATATEVFKAMGATGPVTTDASWGAHHATCTTRMSDSPELGVVDANLKIHGVDNVYVCSNASFSTLSAVNPTLTLVALSLRLGDRLIGGQ